MKLKKKSQSEIFISENMTKRRKGMTGVNSRPMDGKPIYDNQINRDRTMGSTLYLFHYFITYFKIGK